MEQKHGNKRGNTEKRTKTSPKATMNVTEETLVYIWYSRTSNSRSGHSSIKLPKGVYISFRSNDKVKVDKPAYPCDLNEDEFHEGRQPDTLLKIPSYLLHEDDILSWWQEFKEQKDIFLIKDQSCRVIYTALATGSGGISEPLYWTPLALEKYARKLCRRPKKNLFSDIFSFDWFYEMDFQSKFLFFVMMSFMLVLVAMAVLRFAPEGSDTTHTCHNDYDSCKQYMKMFIIPKESNFEFMSDIKENIGVQFLMGVAVIVLCSRFSVGDIIRLVKSSRDEEEGKNEVEEEDDGEGDGDGGDDDDTSH